MKGKPFAVDGAESQDCPVAIIEPEMAQLVHIFNSGRTVRNATGAPMFPDQSAIPARWADAFELMEVERERVQQAAIEAATRSQ